MFTVHLRDKRRPDGSIIGYYAEFYSPDWPGRSKKKWRTLRTRDRSVAGRRLAEMEREAHLGLYDPLTGRRAGGSEITLAAALDAYLASGRREWAPRTVKIKESRLGRFVAAFPPGTQARAVTAKEVRRFIDGLRGRNFGAGGDGRPAPPASQSTRHSYFAQLTGFFNWLHAEGQIPESPMKDVAVGEPADTERVVLRPHEIEAIKTALEADLFGHRQHRGWLADVVDFTAATGLRVSEVAALNWDAVEVWEHDGAPAGAVYVANYSGRGRGGGRSFATKTGKSRRLPLFPRAAEVLARLAPERRPGRREPVFRSAWDGPLSAQEIGRRFTEYVERSRIPKAATFHSLRHTFITWACNDLALPVPTVQRLAGHKRIETSMRYVHVQADTILSAMDRALGEHAPRRSGARSEAADEVAAWMAGSEAYEGWLAERAQNAEPQVPDTAGSVGQAESAKTAHTA